MQIWKQTFMTMTRTLNSWNSWKSKKRIALIVHGNGANSLKRCSKIMRITLSDLLISNRKWQYKVILRLKGKLKSNSKSNQNSSWLMMINQSKTILIIKPTATNIQRFWPLSIISRLKINWAKWAAKGWYSSIKWKRFVALIPTSICLDSNSNSIIKLNSGWIPAHSVSRTLLWAAFQTNLTQRHSAHPATRPLDRTLSPKSSAAPLHRSRSRSTTTREPYRSASVPAIKDINCCQYFQLVFW